MKARRLLPLILALALCFALAGPAAASDGAEPPLGRINTFSSPGAYGAVKPDGTLWMWGTLLKTDLAEGEAISSYYYHATTPVMVLDDVVSFSSGYHVHAAIRSDGSLWTWGYSYGCGAGGEGNCQPKGVTALQTVPVKVMEDVVSVCVDNTTVLAVKSDNTLWGFGSPNGLMGPGRYGPVLWPEQLLDDVVAVSMAYSTAHECAAAIRSDGSLWTWGVGTIGQLGNGMYSPVGDRKSVESPEPVKILENVVQVFMGDLCGAVTADGGLWIWGKCDHILGKNLVDNYESVKERLVDTWDGNCSYKSLVYPTRVLEGVRKVGSTSPSYDNMIAVLMQDGSLLTWGKSTTGMMGSGLTVDSFGYKIRSLTDVADFTISDSNVMALKTDGSLWGWGLAGRIVPGRTEPGVVAAPTKLMEGVMLPGTVRSSVTVGGFRDVRESDYYADAVRWALDSGVTEGMGDGSFGAYRSVTRAQAVTFLWRAAGKPEPETAVSPFTDVSDPGRWYYKAVLWAVEQGVTLGVGNGVFGLESPLAYDQLLTFLCRAAGGSAEGADWSQAALDWAAARGLDEGLSFAAKDACPRCDTVYFLWKGRTLRG